MAKKWLWSVIGSTDRASDVPLAEHCPRCGKFQVLDGASEHGVDFSEPLCHACRSALVRELTMDNFDHAYERARANGWSD